MSKELIRKYQTYISKLDSIITASTEDFELNKIYDSMITGVGEWEAMMDDYLVNEKPITSLDTFVWTENDDIYQFNNVSNKVESLPSGYYTTGYNNQDGKYYFVRHTSHEKPNLGLLPLKEVFFDTINTSFDKFWQSKETYKKYGLPFKRGVLLWGDAGCGKSNLIQQLKQKVLILGGVVLSFTRHSPHIEGIFRILNRAKFDKPVLVILEDIEEILREHEDEVLDCMDGSNTIENVFFVATTNYPGQLKSRITDRPSRFDLVVEIKPPSFNSRILYMNSLLKDEVEENKVKHWASLTNGFSMAHLKEFVISVQVFGNTPEYAEKTIRAMSDKTLFPKEDKEPESKVLTGFTSATLKRIG